MTNTKTMKTTTQKDIVSVSDRCKSNQSAPRRHSECAVDIEMDRSQSPKVQNESTFNPIHTVHPDFGDVEQSQFQSNYEECAQVVVPQEVSPQTVAVQKAENEEEDKENIDFAMIPEAYYVGYDVTELSVGMTSAATMDTHFSAADLMEIDIAVIQNLNDIVVDPIAVDQVAVAPVAVESVAMESVAMDPVAVDPVDSVNSLEIPRAVPANDSVHDREAAAVVSTTLIDSSSPPSKGQSVEERDITSFHITDGLSYLSGTNSLNEQYSYNVFSEITDESDTNCSAKQKEKENEVSDSTAESRTDSRSSSMRRHSPFHHSLPFQFNANAPTKNIWREPLTSTLTNDAFGGDLGARTQLQSQTKTKRRTLRGLLSSGLEPICFDMFKP